MRRSSDVGNNKNNTSNNSSKNNGSNNKDDSPGPNKNQNNNNANEDKGSGNSSSGGSSSSGTSNYDNFTPVLRFAVAGDVHTRDSSADYLSHDRLASVFDTVYDYSENHKKYKELDGIFFTGDNSQSGTADQQTYFFNYLKNNLDKSSIILGPSTAAMFRVNNIYLFQIVIKYRFDEKLFETLKDLDKMYINNNKVNIEIDINPIRI